MVREERQMAVRDFAAVGIHAVDPGAAEQKLWKSGKKSKIAYDAPRKIMEAFVIQDKWLIRHCDALLVMTGDFASDGTWREMCYAETIGIPVIMIAPKRVNGELQTWSNILCQHIVPDLKSAVKLIERKWKKESEAHRHYFNSAIKHAKSALKTSQETNQKAKRRKQ